MRPEGTFETEVAVVGGGGKGSKTRPGRLGGRKKRSRASTAATHHRVLFASLFFLIENAAAPNGMKKVPTKSTSLNAIPALASGPVLNGMDYETTDGDASQLTRGADCTGPF